MSDAMVQQTKVCAHCETEKPLSEFHKQSSTADGHQSWCKICNRTYGRKYRQSTKEMAEEKAAGLMQPIRNYFMRQGAFYDHETGHAGFLKVEEICDEFNLTQTEWYHMRRYLIRNGLPLAYHPFGGHYIGKQGSQVEMGAFMIKSAWSLFQHGVSIIQAAQESKHWDECLPALEDSLNKSRHDIDAGDIARLANAFDVPIKDKDLFAQRLLQASANE